jgi:hypothetical protein
MDDEPKYYACVHSKYDLLEKQGGFLCPQKPRPRAWKSRDLAWKPRGRD